MKTYDPNVNAAEGMPAVARLISAAVKHYDVCRANHEASFQQAEQQVRLAALDKYGRWQAWRHFAGPELLELEAALMACAELGCQAPQLSLPERPGLAGRRAAGSNGT